MSAKLFFISILLIPFSFFFFFFFLLLVVVVVVEALITYPASQFLGFIFYVIHCFLTVPSEST